MDIGEANSALERRLLAEAEGDAHAEWSDSTLHAIGTVIPKLRVCGTKTWTHTANRVTTLTILFDAKNGSLLAIIEAFGVATRWLAPTHPAMRAC